MKRELEKVGLFCFLAHEEIEVSSEWRPEDKSHLQSCDLFLPLIAPNFSSSAWANQETGYSIASGKTVIPLIFDGVAMKGLVEEKQGIPVKSDRIEEGIKSLNE